jgi:hypothetical protein
MIELLEDFYITAIVIARKLTVRTAVPSVSRKKFELVISPI